MDALTPFIIDNWSLWLLLAVVIGLIVFFEKKGTVMGVVQISPSQATQMVNHEQAALFDIREESAYNEGHIVSAIHLPADSIDDKMKKIRKYQKQPVIVYCTRGQSSVRVASQLSKQGFEKVYSLKGGVQAWQNEDLPLIQSKKGQKNGKT